jgi:hypothetical protein
VRQGTPVFLYERIATTIFRDRPTLRFFHVAVCLTGCGTKLSELIILDVNALAKGGRDGVLGRATRYGLDGPGCNPRWGLDFPDPSRSALRLTQPPVHWVRDLFPRGKTAGA